MQVKGNENSHGIVAIALHWSIAVGIVSLLVLGFAADNTTSSAERIDILRVHIVFGIIVLSLALLRVVWRRLNRHPVSVKNQPLWQHRVAQMVHGLLYVVPIVAGVSGIGLLILSKAGPTIFFGSPEALPRFEDFAPMMAHAIAAFTIIGLIVLHVFAALYHQLFKRDRLLARMGIGRSRI